MSFIFGFNVDHVATLRNARGEGYPNVIEIANMAKDAGVNQITAHLREDRRHIKDEDIKEIKKMVNLPLNLEMATTDEMLNIALKTLPTSVCLVPEKREEITTEGGLNVLGCYQWLQNSIPILQNSGIKVDIFIDCDIKNINACLDLGVDGIEINTGKYANAIGDNKNKEIQDIIKTAQYAKSNNISVHAGHGLNLDNIDKIAQIKEITEFNIGHFLIGYAIKYGIHKSIQDMYNLIKNNRT